MSPTRREFIRRFGIALASALAAGCMSPPGRSAMPIDRLRALWTELEVLAKLAQKDLEQSEQLRDDLVTEHRTVLDALVSAGELSGPVAAQVQVAFDAAVHHTWRANAPITCYEPVLIDWRPTGSADLIAQAELLAQAGDLAPETVAQVQAAIERDVAFLSMPTAEVEALYQRVLSDRQADQPIPAFGDVDLDVPSEAVEAARFLVRALLGE